MNTTTNKIMSSPLSVLLLSFILSLVGTAGPVTLVRANWLANVQQKLYDAAQDTHETVSQLAEATANSAPDQETWSNMAAAVTDAETWSDVAAAAKEATARAKAGVSGVASAGKETLGAGVDGIQSAYADASIAAADGLSKAISRVPLDKALAFASSMLFVIWIILSFAGSIWFCLGIAPPLLLNTVIVSVGAERTARWAWYFTKRLGPLAARHPAAFLALVAVIFFFGPFLAKKLIRKVFWVAVKKSSLASLFGYQTQKESKKRIGQVELGELQAKVNLQIAQLQSFADELQTAQDSFGDGGDDRGKRESSPNSSKIQKK